MDRENSPKGKSDYVKFAESESSYCVAQSLLKASFGESQRSYALLFTGCELFFVALKLLLWRILPFPSIQVT